MALFSFFLYCEAARDISLLFVFVFFFSSSVFRISRPCCLLVCYSATGCRFPFPRNSRAMVKKITLRGISVVLPWVFHAVIITAKSVEEVEVRLNLNSVTPLLRRDQFLLKNVVEITSDWYKNPEIPARILN